MERACFMRSRADKLDARRGSVPAIQVTPCFVANETQPTSSSSQQARAPSIGVSSQLQPSPPRTLAIESPLTLTTVRSSQTASASASASSSALPKALTARIGIGRTELLTRSHQSSPTSPKCCQSPTIGDPLARQFARSAISSRRRQTVQFDTGCSPLVSHSFATALSTSNVHVRSASEVAQAVHSDAGLQPGLTGNDGNALTLYGLRANSCCEMELRPDRRSQSQLDTTGCLGQPAALSTPKKEPSASVSGSSSLQSMRRGTMSRLQRCAAPPLSLCVGTGAALTPTALGASLNWPCLTPAGVLSPRFASTLNSPHVAASAAVSHRGAFAFGNTPSQSVALLHRTVERTGSNSSSGVREALALENSLIRMRRTALGQSAPSLSFVPRETSQSQGQTQVQAPAAQAIAADNRRGRRTNTLSIILANEQHKVAHSPPRSAVGSPSVSLSRGGSTTLHAPSGSTVVDPTQAANLSSNASVSASACSRDRVTNVAATLHYQHSHHHRDRPRVEARRWSLPSSGYGTTPTSSSNVSSHASSKENVWLATRSKRLSNDTQSSGTRRGLSKDDSHLGVAALGRNEPLEISHASCAKKAIGDASGRQAELSGGTAPSSVAVSASCVARPAAHVSQGTSARPSLAISCAKRVGAVERSDSCRQLRSASSVTASASIPTSASGSHFGSIESATVFAGSLSATECDLHAQAAAEVQAGSCHHRPPQSHSSGSSQTASPFRPRSRSLTTPSEHGALENDILLLNHVYKERFPNATRQMEEKLEQFIEATQQDERAYENEAIVRFIILQLLELARDCLQVAREQRLTAHYFFQLTENIEKLSLDAREKLLRPCDDLARIMQRLLLIIARPARLLECLEFDPEKFYNLLCVAEGQVKQTTVTDVPRYIVEKLGLKYDPLSQLNDIAADANVAESVPSSVESSFGDAAAQTQTDVGATAKQASTSPRAFLPTKTPVPEDFETIKLISNGAYGAVYLVRHKESRQRFALKKIKKVNLVLRNQVEQVYAERDIMIFLDNPFVVSMYCSFETRKHLCLVMEYVEGGDCATLVKNMGPLPLDLARIYIAETVLAIEYLHSYGIVHRDLKPDNLLITITGHIKLTDFGLSKIGLMNLTTNLYEAVGDQRNWCQFRDKQVFGTPAYIAPEVILRQGYGKPVDWWALGVILYEFLVGCVPFFGESPEELFQQVIDGELEWPDGEFALPAEAVLLVGAMLQLNPAARLGTGGAQEVKEHPFFDGLDWTSLLRLKAEFVPILDNEEDTSYFDTRADRYNHEAEDDEEEGGHAATTQSTGLTHMSPLSSSRNVAPPSASTQQSITGSTQQADSFASHASESISRQISDQDGESSLNTSASEELMFRSFSSCSPRYSRVYEELRHQSLIDKQRHSSDSSHSSLLESRSASQASFTGLPSGLNASTSVSTSQQSNKPIEQLRDRSISASQSTDVFAPLTPGCVVHPTSPLAREMSERKASVEQPIANVSRAHSTKSTSDDRFATPSRSTTVDSITSTCTASTQPSAVFDSASKTTSSSTQMVKPTASDITTGGRASGVPQEASSSALLLAASTQISQQSTVSVVSSSATLQRSNSSSDSAEPSETLLSARQSDEQIDNSTYSVAQQPTTTSKGVLAARTASAQTQRFSPMSSAQIATSSSRDSIASSSSLSLKPPLVINRGPRGFGFTLRAIQVFYEQTDVYILQHLVTDVETGSSAFEAGLRNGDLITHVGNEAVHGLLHTDVIRLIVQSGSRLTLRALPLESTTIRSGPRRNGSKPNEGRMIRPPKRALMERGAAGGTDQPPSRSHASYGPLHHAAAWLRKQRAAATQKTGFASSSSSGTSSSSLSHATHEAVPFAAKPRKLTGSSSSSTSLLRRVSTKRAQELQREQEKGVQVGWQGGAFASATSSSSTPLDTGKPRSHSMSKSRTGLFSHDVIAGLISRPARSPTASQANNESPRVASLGHIMIPPHVQAQLSVNTNQSQPTLSSSLNASASPASSCYSGGLSSPSLSSPASPSPRTRPTSLYEGTRSPALTVSIGVSSQHASPAASAQQSGAGSTASAPHTDFAQSYMTYSPAPLGSAQPNPQPSLAPEANLALTVRRRSFHATATPISPLARTAPSQCSTTTPSAASTLPAGFSGVPLLTPVSNLQQAGLLQPGSPMKNLSSQEPPSPLLRRALSPERKLKQLAGSSQQSGTTQQTPKQ